MNAFIFSLLMERYRANCDYGVKLVSGSGIYLEVSWYLFVTKYKHAHFLLVGMCIVCHILG